MGGRHSLALIYASNEPKSVLVRDLGDYRDNLENSQSMFSIVILLFTVKEFIVKLYENPFTKKIFRYIIILHYSINNISERMRT